MNNYRFIKQFLLAISDILAISFSLLFAYYLRFFLKGYYPDANIDLKEIVKLMLLLSPLWLLLFYKLGLYNNNILYNRTNEYISLVLASVLIILTLIAYDFFMFYKIIYSRMIAIYFMLTSLACLIFGREFVNGILYILSTTNIAVINVLLIGDSSKKSTKDIKDYINANKKFGLNIIACLDDDINKIKEYLQTHNNINLILQVEKGFSNAIYTLANQYYLNYQFIANNDFSLTKLSEISMINGQIAIDVHPTPLLGFSRFTKRVFDLTVSLLLLIILSPLFLYLYLKIKKQEPNAPAIYKQKRLTRFNKEFYIYKFRSMNYEASQMTETEYFRKIGREDLVKEFQKNVGWVENDPRVTKLGEFLRSSSLDELPQLYNVLRGDISLVGPRALLANELNKATDKELILSVKSGLTGLAQVSGRKNIAFEERRRLDNYYVRNWSLLLDLQILIKTILVVLMKIGAK